MEECEINSDRHSRKGGIQNRALDSALTGMTNCEVTFSRSLVPGESMYFSLKVTSGPAVSTSFVLSDDKPLVFGRLDSNDCVLSNDAAISRKHFEINFEDGKCRITDLDSRNGTYLNDHSIMSSELNSGDEIRVGSTRRLSR